MNIPKLKKLETQKSLLLIRKNQAGLINLLNKNTNTLLAAITKFLQLLFVLEMSLFNLAACSPVVNTDNKIRTNNAISYSNFIKNSNLGYIFYSENQIKNITDDAWNTGIQYSSSASFIKIGQKAQIELTSQSEYRILNSVYLQKDNNNLTYLNDYLIKFNVDDSVIPYYNFHTEGVKNSSLLYPPSPAEMNKWPLKRPGLLCF